MEPSPKIVIKQGSTGIRQWPINECTPPTIIHKIIPVCLKLVVETFGH